MRCGENRKGQILSPPRNPALSSFMEPYEKILFNEHLKGLGEMGKNSGFSGRCGLGPTLPSLYPVNIIPFEFLELGKFTSIFNKDKESRCEHLFGSFAFIFVDRLFHRIIRIH